MSEWLAATFAPFWQTPLAVAEVLGLASVGTTLVGLFLFIAALELLRSSGGIVALFARGVAIGAVAFIGASFVYGDFMAPAAKAIYLRLAARMPQDHTSTVLAATMGAATAGLALSSSRRGASAAPPRRTRTPSEARSRLDLALVMGAVDPARVSALGKAGVLDAASRIQMRLLTNKPVKAVVKKVPRGRGQPRNGQPAFWRVRRV